MLVSTRPSATMGGDLLSALVWSLLLILVLSFLATHVLAFYIFFEISLIPIFLIIAGWGYQPERLSAGTFLLIYTVRSSMPLLAVLMFTLNLNLCSFYELCSISGLTQEGVIGGLMTLSVTLGFLVKIPIYLTHV